MTYRPGVYRPGAFRATAFLLCASQSLASLGHAQVDPRPRNVWYEFVQDAVRYGYQHVRVTKEADGTFRYKVDSRVLVDLFGAQRQEITTHAEYLVTSRLRPVSLRIDSTDLSGKSKVTGQMKGEDFVLSIRSAGAVNEKRIPRSTVDDAIFSTSLEDRLAASASSEQRVGLQVISDGVWEPQRMVATRMPGDHAAGAVWKVTEGKGGLGSIYTFDKHGILESVLSEQPRLHIRRCTEEQAKKLTYRKMDGRELLTFPLDKPIHAPDRLRKLSVRLTFTDVPFEELQLEDARQRITRRTEKDGRHTIDLRIEEPAKLSSKATIPIQEPGLKRYLAETMFVKPAHAKILAAAKDALQGEENAVAAVRALSKWVHGYIEGKLIARTLTGPEVLAFKSGKCTEYSTLFASMARSVGIPTRLVLGERMVAGSWMGHMWNEAYVGRWVTVDASVNEVDRSFTLLKFTHSDTVAGTQPVRWKLTKSLAIAIQDYELTPSKLEGKYKTGIVGATYTNTDHACRIVADDKAWVLKDVTTPGAAGVRFKRIGDDSVQVHFVTFALPAGTLPKTLIDNRLRMWRGLYKEVTQIKNEAVKVAGATGHTLRISGLTKGKSALTNYTTEVLWIRGGSGFLLNLITLKAAHEKYLPEYEKLLAGFRFLEE